MHCVESEVTEWLPPPAFSGRHSQPPSNVPEGAHHVFQVAENILGRGQPFKSLD